ncbi:immune-associated nucleotide-binding protein 6 [Plakobranchus ocellatus]|uniref:Immune-associated nucleotide-binding protein 6 n=1 Tax=Plakobranchus ocellatus TaxID=259542 RepID=A0AAV4A9H6_9GAST|nr:immune-associated nucleotide-binding protein 6 [Plakobranchus ocellatus]
MAQPSQSWLDFQPVFGASKKWHIQLDIVVDGPGIEDTRLDKQDSVDLVANKIAQALLISPRGYHAFLLVTKYDVRFTEEDKDTIQFLKNLFGLKFVSKYCILVMTCGDLFQHNIEENSFGYTFSRWCRSRLEYFRTC